MRFGRLLVLERSILKRGNDALWICNCDCGTERCLVTSSTLTQLRIPSCGCVLKEIRSKRKERARYWINKRKEEDELTTNT